MLPTQLKCLVSKIQALTDVTQAQAIHVRHTYEEPIHDRISHLRASHVDLNFLMYADYAGLRQGSIAGVC